MSKKISNQIKTKIKLIVVKIKILIDKSNTLKSIMIIDCCMIVYETEIKLVNFIIYYPTNFDVMY